MRGRSWKNPQQTQWPAVADPLRFLQSLIRQEGWSPRSSLVLSCLELQNVYKMCFLGAWILLHIFLHLAHSKPLVNQGRLLTKENAHEDSGEHGDVEGEARFNFNTFLENLKADFLRSLNLSEVPSQEKSKEEPPQFMIDLYNRYAKDKSSSPISNIVRSFRPEGRNCLKCVGEDFPRRRSPSLGDPRRSDECSVSSICFFCLLIYCKKDDNFVQLLKRNLMTVPS